MRHAGRVARPSDPPHSGRALPTAGWTRLLRIAVFAVASLLIAGLAHLAGGGRPPSAGLGLVLAALTGTVAAAVTARRCRLPLLAVVLSAEQVVLHLLFAASGPMDCASAAAMPVSHLGVLSCPDGAATATAHSESLLMLGAHTFATALTTWLLARGEAALWRLADRVVRAALPLLAARWPARAPRVRVLPPLPAARAASPHQPAAPRGPPAGCTATG